MKILYENTNYDIELNVIDNDLTDAVYSVTCSRPDLITITQDPIEKIKFTLEVGELDDTRVMVKMNYIVIDNSNNSNITHEYITLSKGMVNDNRYYTKIEFDNLFVKTVDYEDEDVLNKLLNVTVVGVNSGLDADMVQNIHASQVSISQGIPASNETKQIDQSWMYYKPYIISVRTNLDLHSKNNSFIFTIDAYDPKEQDLVYELICDDPAVIITQEAQINSFKVTYPDYGSDTVVTYTMTVTNTDNLFSSMEFEKKILVDLTSFDPVIIDVLWNDENHTDNNVYFMLISASDPRDQNLTYEVECDDVNVGIVQDEMDETIFHVTYPNYTDDTTVTYTITVTNEDLLTDTWTEVKIVEDVLTGNRGVFSGGINGGYSNMIDYVTISTPGNAIDFGDLSVIRYKLAACSNGVSNRGVFGGGANTINALDIIDYITIAILGNATSFGDLTTSRRGLSATSNGTNDRGIFGGGNAGGKSNVIDYITISSIGNAADFGDLLDNKDELTATSNGTNDRGIFGGGNNSNEIEYITISSPGNAIDFEDLTIAREILAATSNGTNDRGVFGGGTNGNDLNTIDYITISSIGNAVDFGDLSVARKALAATSNGINDKGVFGGGDISNVNSNIIDHITISTPGNAANFGNLSNSRHSLAACSNG